jgi:hypothetical protein
VFLRDGTALYDRLGRWFTLLVTGNDSGAGMVRAARTLGVALVEVRLEEPRLAPLYEADMLLVRPDHHVAWRGKAPATDVEALRIVRLALGW